MADLQLSNGTIIRTEHIERAEFYPIDSLSSYGCQFGGPELRDCPFLFVQMRHGAERINGAESEKDATELEARGVHVVRHPVKHQTPPL